MKIRIISGFFLLSVLFLAHAFAGHHMTSYSTATKNVTQQSLSSSSLQHSKNDQTHTKKPVQPHPHVVNNSQEPNGDSLNNLMFRETIHNNGSVSVDPFSGKFKLRIHLIDVKLNDGLHLRFSLNNTASAFLYNLSQLYDNLYAGPLGYLIRGTPGISNLNIFGQDGHPFLFTDPAGNVHHFYLHVNHSPQANTYLSTDGWIAQLYPNPTSIQRQSSTAYGNYYTGYIHSPNGTTYNWTLDKS